MLFCPGSAVYNASMGTGIDPVTLFLVSIAAIFLIGALGELTFQRTNIPDVIWLIGTGILLGPVLGFVGTDLLRDIAPYFAALTLVVVLFEGGTALKLGELSQAAPRSGALALASFLSSVAALTVVSMAAKWAGLLPESWSWLHGLMLGAILGGSSSIVIMPAMAQARLPASLANLVNLESALTDAFCVVATSALIDIIVGGDQGGNPALALFRSFGIALALGAIVGLLWIVFLRFLPREQAYPITLAALLMLYVVIDNAGGSAALGILTVAVFLGNAPSISRAIGLQNPVALDTEVRGFHHQLAFIVKSFFFVFIGAMLTPPWSVLLFGMLLGGVLFLARWPAVSLAMYKSPFDATDRALVQVALPRGMAAGVLATLPMASGVPGTEQLPAIVFAAVLSTILMFAVGFPLVKRRVPHTQAMPDIHLPAGSARPEAPHSSPKPAARDSPSASDPTTPHDPTTEAPGGGPATSAAEADTRLDLPARSVAPKQGSE